MKKVIGITLVVIVLALLAYPKVKPLLGNSNTSSQGASSAQNSTPLPVEGFIVQPDAVDDNIFTTGTLRANEEVELSSESSGLIEDIYLQEGREVQKGELLVKINDSELQAQLQRAEFRYNLASDREERQAQLLEQGGISQEEYDATLNEVNVLKSESDLIKAQIAKTEIRAPFDGRLGLKYVSDGSYITPATRIATLQDISVIKIDFSIPERYAALIESGKRIAFTVEGIADTLTAEVYATEPRIDTETRTLQVRAQTTNPEKRLLPGAFADLQLTLNTIENALMVPTISLVPELDGQKVFLVKNGVVQPSSVQTGLRTESAIQITEGVAVGDTILTTGLLQVRPGMSVDLINLEQ